MLPKLYKRVDEIRKKPAPARQTNNSNINNIKSPNTISKLVRTYTPYAPRWTRL